MKPWMEGAFDHSAFEAKEIPKGSSSTWEDWEAAGAEAECRSDIVDTDFDEKHDETRLSYYQRKFSWETSELPRSKNHDN